VQILAIHSRYFGGELAEDIGKTVPPPKQADQVGIPEKPNWAIVDTVNQFSIITGVIQGNEMF